MRDAWGRKIDYFRISVTDRCNLRCFYCMPEEGVPFKSHDEILRYEEILRIVRCATSLGIRRVRVTGGEPLVRKGLPGFLRALTCIDGVSDVSITTNGILLADLATDIRKAGVSRINVSLDSLKPDRYEGITRGQPGSWERVWRGIEEALKLGFDPVKINVVAMRGVNDDELLDFAHLTVSMPIHVRFIEIMPLGEEASCTTPGATDWKDLFVSGDTILERLSLSGSLHPTEVKGAGPARYYRLDGAKGTIGIISAISRHFCPTCNRLRMTADGKVSPCLASNDEVDIGGPLRRGVDDSEIVRILRFAIMSKPLEHDMEAPDVAAESHRIMKEAAVSSGYEPLTEGEAASDDPIDSRVKPSKAAQSSKNQLAAAYGMTRSCPTGLGCPSARPREEPLARPEGGTLEIHPGGGSGGFGDKSKRRMSQLGG
ncbi:MAG TPA: GTP 3',8-cyclase MoaA [Clostridia bacterium]|nr:GTP 3',8-cyclase MoaA [Clostridia bacterium]